MNYPYNYETAGLYQTLSNSHSLKD